MPAPAIPPCGTPQIAPVACAVECTTATMAFEKAMPASVEALAMAKRASRSLPSSTARTRYLTISSIAALA